MKVLYCHKQAQGLQNVICKFITVDYGSTQLPREELTLSALIKHRYHNNVQASAVAVPICTAQGYGTLHVLRIAEII